MAHSPTRPAEVPRIRLRTPAQLAAAVPYLVGFPPVESLVLIGLAGEPPHVVVTMRIDLPGPAAIRSAARDMVGYLGVAGAHRALVVLATEAGERRPREDVLTAVEAAAGGAGIEVTEALLLRAGRWYSYHCPEPSCCPPDGTAVDATEVGELAAAAAYSGRVVHPSRAHLVDSLAPVEVEAELSAQAHAMFQRVHTQLVRARVRRGRPRVADQSRRLLTAAVQRRREGGSPLALTEVARLATGLCDVLVRDWALGWIDGDLEDAAESLWVELTRRSRGTFVAPPATLLAVHAYLRGDGVYARTALDRAQDADPGYSFAGLLARGLDRGVPPSTLRAAVEAARGPR